MSIIQVSPLPHCFHLNTLALYDGSKRRELRGRGDIIFAEYPSQLALVIKLLGIVVRLEVFGER
ncbi:hypothetical protein E4U57_003773 [Claviceps arundinis]|uniref:Uncharacterized protein n=1 Tax=Claviceps arundinis TaxID=1623583 RepID=A0A9P7SMZ8_9HYPO|nr:hypothetical protein E4U57_003773 [Claviceps arundinis]KAG5959537.1 hypothetical protein E4U56_004963 [Claviceps arundinis]